MAPIKKAQIIPIGDRLAVRVLPDLPRASGLYVPADRSAQTQRAEVVATGKITDDVRIGDVVMMIKDSGLPVDGDVVVIGTGQALAVIERAVRS